VLGKRDLHHETREGIDLLFKRVFGRICSREAKTKFRQCDWSAKKFAEKKLDQFLLFYSSYSVASREQIRPVENVILVIVILLPVKYTVTVKDHVKSVLRISSAHNKGGPTDINIAHILHLSNFFELKRTLVYIHLQ
jgi:hypothetical protein